MISRILGNWTLVLCGDASYALYLFHYPLLGYYRWVFGDRVSAIAFVPFFLFVQILSIVAFKLVEVPARRALRGMLVS